MSRSQNGDQPIIWPPVHHPDATDLLVERGLECHRPGCGCTEWDLW